MLVEIAACSRAGPNTGASSADARVHARVSASVDAGDEPAATTMEIPALARLTREEACLMPVAERGEGRPGLLPYSRADGTCEGSFCDVVERAPKGADSCFIATANIARQVAASVTLLDHHGDPRGPSIGHQLDAGRAVFAFTLPETVRDSPHGIEGMHIGVVGSAEGGGPPERWDLVTKRGELH